MNVLEGLELCRKRAILDRLLPYGIDRTMAIVILYALNVDITLFGIFLDEEGIDEDSYWSILRRLSFKVQELTDEERELLNAYCMNFITKSSYFIKNVTEK